MRPAKAPAALVASWPCTVLELTNEALIPETLAARSGIWDAWKGGTHAGLLVSRVVPLGRQFVALLLACNIRNDGRIASAVISLIALGASSGVPRRPTVTAWK